jgi:hypothetical protein
MINLVEMIAYEEDVLDAPCKHGVIIAGHACYCHHESPEAPRKCPIWRNGDDWTKENCELFDSK